MSQHRILLIEDDVLMMRVFERQFKDRGYAIDIVNDGAEAMAYIDSMIEKPAVICLDIMVPNVNGLEILKHLKANDSLKDIPVVILSNVGEHKEIEEAKSLGVQAYFTKSDHEPSEVVGAVEEIIGKASAEN